MKTTHLLRRIKSDLTGGENLDAYVAILLGATFTILGVLGQVNQQWLSNFVLLALTFLVIMSLKNRYVFQDAEKALRASSNPDASDVLKDRAEYEPLDVRLLGAQDVIVIGRHLLGFVGFNRDVIRKFAKRGCAWKFIVMDPALETPEQSLSADIERSILTLQQIGNEYPDKILIRTSRRIVPCAVFAVDMDKPHGLIQIQPHALFVESELREHYDLRASNSSRWYAHYREQIELLWADSTPFPIGTDSTGRDRAQ
jgi:hypothetical protein